MFGCSDGKEDGQCKAPGKDMRVSLSNFLDRKLQKGSGVTKSVQVYCLVNGLCVFGVHEF